MAALGLGSLKDKKKTDKAKKGSQADEAKAILERMEQKKDAGDCPFC